MALLDSLELETFRPINFPPLTYVQHTLSFSTARLHHSLSLSLSCFDYTGHCPSELSYTRRFKKSEGPLLEMYESFKLLRTTDSLLELLKGCVD